MEHKNARLKIIIVDKEEEMGHRVKEVFQNISNYNYIVKWYSSLVVDEIKGAHCIIIDSRLIKDIKNLIEVLKALSVAKIVISTNELNHPISSTAILMGANVFYRHSPVTTLLPKIIDDFVQQKLNKPIQSFSNSNQNFNSSYNLNKDSRNIKFFENDRGKLVMFYSPKGGVGKTSLVLNCAVHFALKKLKVLVVDYSLFGSIRIKLKVDAHNLGLSSIIATLRSNKQVNNFDQFIRENIYSYKFGANKFDVLTSDVPVNMSSLNTEIVEYINSILRTFDYDIVLIDSSPDISPLNRTLFELSNEIVNVGGPDISSTWALIQHKEIMHNLNLLNKCKLVVNMFVENSGFLPNELEMELQYPLLSVIPEYNKVKTLENTGSFVSLTPDDAFNTYYRQLAHNLIPVFGSEDIIMQKKKFSFNIFK